MRYRAKVLLKNLLGQRYEEGDLLPSDLEEKDPGRVRRLLRAGRIEEAGEDDGPSPAPLPAGTGPQSGSGALSTMLSPEEGLVGGAGTLGYPRPSGGGWYILSNGDKVQGREAAEEAEAELSG